MNHRVCLLICGTLLLSGALAIPVENKAQDDSVLKIFETTDTENVQASPSCYYKHVSGCGGRCDSRSIYQCGGKEPANRVMGYDRWHNRYQSWELCRDLIVPDPDGMSQAEAKQCMSARCTNLAEFTLDKSNYGVNMAGPAQDTCPGTVTAASSCPSNGCDGCWWRGRCRTITKFKATQAKCSRNKGVWCAKASTMKPTVCPSTNDICAGKAKCEPKCLCPRCLKPTVCPSTKDICAGKAKCEPKCPCPMCKEPFPAANTKEYSKLKSACRGHVKNLDELKRLFEKQGGFEGALKYCVQPRPCPVAACMRPKPGCHYVPNEKDANGCIVGCGKLECKEIEPKPIKRG